MVFIRKDDERLITRDKSPESKCKEYGRVNSNRLKARDSEVSSQFTHDN